MRKSVTLIAIFAAMTFLGCAGRDAVPVTLVQPQDQVSSCSMIAAEIEANNQKVQQLADEKGIKVAQNVAAGVGGLIVWPLFFAMDFKDAAGTEMAALQQRQQYLGQLAAQRCRR